MHSPMRVPLSGLGLPELASAALAVLLLGAPGAAWGQAGTLQSKAQQKCIVDMNKALAKVSKAQGKLICSCMKDASKNKLPGTIGECLEADLKAKVSKATAKTLAKELKRCPSDPNSPDYPDFAYTSGELVNTTGIDRPLALIQALFGSDLDTAIVAKGDAKTLSKCQLDVAKAAKKCFDTKLKVFNKCKKAGLKGKPVPGSIPDALDLSELCLMQGADPNTGQPDPKVKIQKACVTKLQAKITKKCGGVDLALAFPGLDPNADLQASIDARVECEVCRAINLADGLSRDCDRFDDGLANGSCSIVLTGCSEEAPPDYDSTFDAIQAIILEGYGCANTLCHDAVGPQAGLDLTAGSSYGNLVGVESSQLLTDKLRVEPGDQNLSFLYELLAKGTFGSGSDFPGMPAVGSPLTEDHLEAIKLWIRGGAPRDGIVAETAEVLGSCLPEPTPLTLPIPDAPDPNVGVQFRQPPWQLPSQSENEICMATYYDLTATDLVPDWAKVPCVDPNDNNPSDECFLYQYQKLYQDPQSHHSIIHIYQGDYPTTDPGWGPFTYKFADPNHPDNGLACDPTAVDPNTGYNLGCSGVAQESVACIFYGPPDYGFGGLGGGNDNAPQFSGSQEPVSENTFADGVYSLLPMTGIIVWNGHAFNLTSSDTTMSQYLDLEFAEPNNQLYPAEAIFDAGSIFIQNVPPFETREYCRAFRLPQNALLYGLSSHTHRHGIRFRIWGPPNSSCTPGSTCVPGDPNQLIYESLEYTDPVQLDFDPPIPHPGNGNSRRYLFCSLYDNGSSEDCGHNCVKRQSTSPQVPQFPGLGFIPGGPCDDSELQCMDGPNKGELCFNQGGDAWCDSSSGAGDGECDACPLLGGVTTEDEMFIMIGGYYCENPTGCP